MINSTNAQLIAKYFDKFGDIWADAYFSRQIAMGYPGTLFTNRYQFDLWKHHSGVADVELPFGLEAR
jgi:hypothetical protein